MAETLFLDGDTLRDTRDGVADGVTSGVATTQDAFCGGSATPRNTLPVGAVASTVTTCVPVSNAYSVVGVDAKRTNAPPAVLLRPVMEYIGDVVLSEKVATMDHAPPMYMVWKMLQ